MKILLSLAIFLTIVPALSTVGSQVQIYNDISQISFDTSLFGNGSFTSGSLLNPSSMLTVDEGATRGKNAGFKSSISLSAREGYVFTQSGFAAGMGASSFNNSALYSIGSDYTGTDYFILPGKSLSSTLYASGTDGASVNMVGFASPNQFTDIKLSAETITGFKGRISFSI